MWKSFMNAPLSLFAAVAADGNRYDRACGFVFKSVPLPSPLKRDIDDSRPNLRISFKSEASLRDTLVSRSHSVRLPFQTSSALNGNVI